MQSKINKLKIVHFIHKPFLAGAQRASLDILKSIDKSKYDTYLIFANDLSFEPDLRNDFINEFESIGVKIFPLSSLKQNIGLNDFFTLIELFKILLRIKPDIINTISSKPFFLGGIISFLLRVPIRIHTIQGLSWYSKMPFHKKYFRYFLEQISILFFNKIVFVNNYYMKYFPLQKYKSIYIPNGKKFDNFHIQLKNNDTVKILFVGRLDFQKDPMTLIKSFEHFLLNYTGGKSVILDIVGDGPDKVELEKYITQSTVLTGKVVFHGWSNDVNRYLKLADIFISTPRYEAFGFVFLEAANFYLPVISTNVEGVPEVVMNNQGGFLNNTGDYESISKAICLFVEDSNLRFKFGKFHGEYCRDKYLDLKVEKLYKKLYNIL